MSISVIPGRRWLESLLQDNKVVELRGDTGKGFISGWFDNAPELFFAVENSQYANLYSTVNRPRLAAATNRFSWDTPALKGDNVESFSRLFFDFDPVRPPGMPATNLELQAATDRAKGFMRDLQRLHWPRPAFGISGNGAHLQYRVRLLADANARQLMPRLYRALAARYSDDAVKFDRSVCHPGGLTRVYGTRNRKGTSTPGRPHRLSSIWMPQEYRRVELAALWELMCTLGIDHEPASKPLPTRSPGKLARAADYCNLDIVAWFTRHGYYLKHLESNKHAVCCPWKHEHTTSGGAGETIIYEADGGWPGFYCQHSHCDERRIRDVLELFGDGDRFCGRASG